MLPPATLIYTLALAFVSLLPGGPGAPGGWDRFLSPSTANFLHFPAYTVLTILVLASAASRFGRRPIVTVSLVGACILLGVVLECLQAYIPGRFASLADMVTNAAGAAVGLLAWRYGVTKLSFLRPYREAVTDRSPGSAQRHPG